MRCAARSTFFICALIASAARADDAILRFERDGTLVRELSLPALRKACHEARIEVDDPDYAHRKTFRACPLQEVLAAGFGKQLGPADADANFFLRARDGYTKPASGARLAESGGYLAFEDLSNPAGKGWEPIDRRQADPGPFYLVWTGAAQQDAQGYPWPYQLEVIERVPFERVFPHVVPTGEPEGSPARVGFAIFRGECISCHAINGEGGRVGPDLNIPRSIVEYRPAEQIRAFIRDPQTFRYTSMPPHPQLSEVQLDGLVAYFRAMSQRKSDPGKPADAGSP
jgi:mono/diheme cytochrome c family protein